MCAEFMHQEYKDQSVWYSIAGYTAATATGVLRMYNVRHWFSDVVAGAGIGILGTKLRTGHFLI
jgi:membrane-associated phospholipid phosphatase